MTVLNTGSTKQYSDNWGDIFGKPSRKKKSTKKKAAKKKASAKKKTATKKTAKKRPAKKPKATGRAKKKSTRKK